MYNNLSLELKCEPSISYSYSVAQDNSIEINSINLIVNLKVGKSTAGYSRLGWDEVIKKTSKSAKADPEQKKITVKVYEKMIEQLQEQINLLTN